ncbi:hypothetical protein [Tessaracoccus coleopterorum]|uniref:hypothetical protein n=1 Tax=Tessaracoccus coleopterorum TaxID=2714950 RepID=UPI0018D274D0|nr:hypothetical protein [Tessaracoccus coleopterorum]
MTPRRQFFGGNLRQFGMLFALIALVAFFQFRTGGKVLTPTNLMNLLNGNSYILVLAIGMVLVIIAGHIDLSVGSIAAVVGIAVALIMRDWSVPWPSRSPWGSPSAPPSAPGRGSGLRSSASRRSSSPSQACCSSAA